jgi:hypothetical protein
VAEKAGREIGKKAVAVETFAVSAALATLAKDEDFAGDVVGLSVCLAPVTCGM